MVVVGVQVGNVSTEGDEWEEEAGSCDEWTAFLSANYGGSTLRCSAGGADAAHSGWRRTPHP